MTTAVEKLIRTARQHGVEREQLSGFLARGYVSQPRQLAFHGAARSCDKPNGPTRIGFGGARGPGKSHAMLAQAALDDCQRFPGLKVLYLRKVGKAAKEAIRDQRLTVLGKCPHEFNGSEATINFPNGSRIILGNFKDEKDIDKYLGLEYDLIIIEEATTLSKSKIDNILTCLRTSKANWRPRAYFTTNPGNIGHAWFKEMFITPMRKGAETDTRFIPATVYDNQFMNREYRALLERLTGWQRRAWLEGDWDVAAGQFYTTWRADRHVKKVSEMPPLPSQRWDNGDVWGGFDYGYRHFTAAYLMALDGDGGLWIYDEHAAQKTLVEKHAQGIEAMVERNGGRLEDLSFQAGHDCFNTRHTGGTIAADYDNFEVALKRANIDRISGAAELVRRLGDADEDIEQSIYISERCTRLIECIPMLQHDPNRAEDVHKTDADDNGVGGDDFYDAARYGWMKAARRAITVY